MATKLDESLKRELEVNGELYMLTISPEGMKMSFGLTPLTVQLRVPPPQSPSCFSCLAFQVRSSSLSLGAYSPNHQASQPSRFRDRLRPSLRISLPKCALVAIPSGEKNSNG